MSLDAAVLRFAGAWAAFCAACAALLWSLGQIPLLWLMASPLYFFTVPVNPQGRGDFYLHAEARYPVAA